MDQEPAEVNSRKEGREVRRRDRPVERGAEGEGRVVLMLEVERVVGVEGGEGVGGQMVLLRMGVDSRD